MERRNKLRRSPLQRSTPLRQTSTRRRREERDYAALRAAFLTGRPMCEAGGGCQARATDVHHKRGRGALLLRVDLWLPLCRPCHQWVTEHPHAAVALGLSELRVCGPS